MTVLSSGTQIPSAAVSPFGRTGVGEGLNVNGVFDGSVGGGGDVEGSVGWGVGVGGGVAMLVAVGRIVLDEAGDGANATQQ